MAKIPGYYDIECGDDVNLVKVAADNGNFHYVRIHADVAKTVDFSGGIRGVDTVTLEKCYKLGRIIWPEETGSIQRLHIYGSENLTSLDLHQLHNLQQLYIFNCPALAEISGLSSELRELFLHQVRINQLNLSAATELEKINIITYAPKFKLNAANHEQLLEVILEVKSQNKKDIGNVNCILSGNPSLYQVCIRGNASPVKLDLRQSHGVREVLVSGAMKSTITGLDDCKALTFLSAGKNILLKDVPQSKIDYRLSKNQAGKKTDYKSIAANIQTKQNEFKAYVQNFEPGIDDKEIIIQERTAKREIGQRGSVKIQLLGAEFRQVKAVNENDLRNAARVTSYGKHYFLPSPSYTMYYINHSAEWKRPARVVPNALNAENSNEIKKWLTNGGQLLVPSKLIKNNVTIRKFLTTYIKKTTTFYYQGKKFERRINHVILLTGSLPEITAALPVISNSIAIITLEDLGSTQTMSGSEFANLLKETHEMSHVRSQHESINQVKTIGEEFMEAHNIASATPFSTEDPGQHPASSSVNSDDIPQQQPVSGRSAAPDAQYPLDGAASQQNSPPSDMHGKAAPQVKVRHEPIPGQQPVAARDAVPDTNKLIEADAQNDDDDFPEAMDGKTAPQYNIYHKPADSQFLIYGAAEDNPPEELHGRTAPQHPVQALAGKAALASAPPLIPEEAPPQHLIDVDKKVQSSLETVAPLKPDDVPPQHLLGADKAMQAPLQIEETLPQYNLNADKKLHEPLQESPALTPDETPPQVLLSANRLFFDTKTQAVAAPDTKLYEAAKNLAVVMRDMLNAVEARKSSDHKKSSELAQASCLMKSAEKELERAKHTIKLNEQQKSDNKLRESMLEAGRQMIYALQALNIACKLDVMPSPAPEENKIEKKNDFNKE